MMRLVREIMRRVLGVFIFCGCTITFCMTGVEGVVFFLFTALGFEYTIQYAERFFWRSYYNYIVAEATFEREEEGVTVLQC